MSTESSIAYLGPLGTNTHEAARIFAGRLGLTQPEYVECSSFDEVFDYVDNGRCEFGVVALENSLEGSVTATLDNFAFNSDAVILAEEVLNIHHCLLLHPDASIDDITTIASHPQGLAQCRHYITEALPGRQTLSTSSTAESARMAASDIHTAGIANTYAAELYGACVYAENIEDNAGNQTRFGLIGHAGHAQAFEGNTYKTTAALFINEDRPGTLLMILSELAYAGINLTMIQSRPTKQGLGNYMFFITFEQPITEPHVKTALDSLRLKLREVKIIGSYPICNSH